MLECLLPADISDSRATGKRFNALVILLLYRFVFILYTSTSYEFHQSIQGVVDEINSQ